jgi:hypothetical protein
MTLLVHSGNSLAGEGSPFERSLCSVETMRNFGRWSSWAIRRSDFAQIGVFHTDNNQKCRVVCRWVSLALADGLFPTNLFA